MKLFLITLIAGVCLGAAYEVTKAPIALAQVANEQKQYKGVFEEAASFEENTAENDKIESSAAEISKTYSNAKIEKVMVLYSLESAFSIIILSPREFNFALNTCFPCAIINH